MSAEHTIELEMPHDGIHVIAQAFESIESNETETTAMLQIQVFPLPKDNALMDRITTAARNAINKVLTEDSITSGEETDLSSNGTLQ